MAYLRRFVLMLQFMTTIPIKLNIKAEHEDFGKGLTMAPVVGLVIGVLLAGANYLLGLLFPLNINAIFTVALYIVLTGGLHLDGLGDTADGLFSNRPRERMLEIMKDSRVGTNAVLVVVIVLMLNSALIASLGTYTEIILLLMPIAGRIGSLIASASSNYAGTSDGPGRWCVECCGRNDIITGLVFYFILLASTACFYCLLTSDLYILKIFLMTAIIPPLSAFFVARFLGRKIGGVTGDVLGAVCELNQLIFLTAAFLLAGM